MACEGKGLFLATTFPRNKLNVIAKRLKHRLIEGKFTKRRSISGTFSTVKVSTVKIPASQSTKG